MKTLLAYIASSKSLRIADFAFTVLLIAGVEAVAEKIIFGEAHETSHFKEQVIEALSVFNPFELASVYMHSIGKTSVKTSETREYRNCMREGGYDPISASEAMALDILIDGPETSPLLKAYLELRNLPPSTPKCFREAKKTWNGLMATRVPVIGYVDGAWRSIVFTIERGEPAFRLIILCQLLVGAYGFYLIWNLRSDRDRMTPAWEFCTLVAVLPMGSIFVGSILAIPLGWLALVTLKLLTATYIATGLKVVEKTVDNIMHSIAHFVIERFHERRN